MDSEKCQPVSVTVSIPGELSALLVERLDGGSVSDYVRRLIRDDLERVGEKHVVDVLDRGSPPALKRP